MLKNLSKTKKGEKLVKITRWENFWINLVGGIYRDFLTLPKLSLAAMIEEGLKGGKDD